MSIIEVPAPGEAGQQDETGQRDGEVALGYINMPDSRPRRVRVVERRLRDGARECGWSLGEIFSEEMPGSQDAFERMQTALQHGQARRVVIASFRQFARDRFTQDLMLESLENDLDVDVVALDEDLPLDRDPVPVSDQAPVGAGPVPSTPNG